MLRTPSAAAPSRSACRASRFRSRTVSCMMGSIPFSTRRWAAASDDMWTCAPVLSVQLTASTDPRSTSASRQVASGSALLVDVSSAVTTKRPSRSSPARRLGAGIGLPTLWGDAVSTTDEVDPRGGALQLPINGLLQVLDVIFEDRQAPRALPGFDPEATLVRLQLAVTVGARAATGAVAQVLGAPHWAAEAGRVQDALSTHAAVPHRFLQRLLDGDQEALDNAHVLALAQRLVDEFDRLSQCCVLSGLRRADDLLGHPGGEGGVGRVVVGAGELGVLLGDRSPADHHGDLVAQAGL